MGKVQRIKVNREGFWKTSDEDSRLPLPVSNSEPWKGQRKFLRALSSVESEAWKVYYKGLSTCRLCGKKNGSSEYADGSWVWPAGYRHYIEGHNVRPSLAFQEFVLGEEVK